MIKNAIIWRESIYRNHFKCNRCGEKLADDKGIFIANKIEANIFFGRCFNCKNTVLMLQEVEAPAEIAGLQGYWHGEF